MNDPVQHQLEAYNDRDLEAFMEAYSPDVRIEDGSGEEILNGLEAMRGFYEGLFENSTNLQCEVVSRVSVGNWVIDEEEVSSLPSLRGHSGRHRWQLPADDGSHDGRIRAPEQ